MERDFNKWLNTFIDSIASWNYYTDFDKVYSKVDSIKNELNLLNGLIASTDIENEFKQLVQEYPKVLNVIPILLAIRSNIIFIKDSEQDYSFNFKKMNYSIDDYIMFMRKTGLFELFEKHLISSVYDYVTGVEVGMDTNARKNRTGDAMEDITEGFIAKAGFVKDINYFKEVSSTKIKNTWNIDISNILEKVDNEIGSKKVKLAEKRFDFVIEKNNILYLIETNFYGSQGSKLSETARSYKKLDEELKKFDNVKFIWFTDGFGWHSSARNNLQDTFETFKDIYNINDLKNNILDSLIK